MGVMKKRRWVLVVAWLAGGLAIAALVLATISYHAVKRTADNMFEPIAAVQTETKAPAQTPEPAAEGPETIRNTQPFCLLLLGIDQRPKRHDDGRSDSIVIAAVNPAKKSTLLFNIPRDTRADIVGKGVKDKINHAYAFGGIKMSVDTVSEFLHLQIPYYIKINMESFAQIIDDLGGVNIDNAFTFKYEGHDFPQGAIHLDGVEALKYSRMRKQDPRGDFGRTERQRQIIRAVADKSTDIMALLKSQKLMETLGDNVKTNIRFTDMKQLYSDYRPALKNFSSFEIQGQGQMIDGIYYYIVSDAERERISRLLQEQLH